MVAGAAGVGGQEVGTVDDLGIRLDRYFATPSGSLTFILLTALTRLLINAMLDRRARKAARKHKKAPNAG